MPLKETKQQEQQRHPDTPRPTKRVQMWVDRPSYLGESAARARSIYRMRTTVTGEAWTGFVARWGLAFASFRPADVSCGGGAGGGAPWGLCALLLHRTLVGLAIGALGGEARKVGQVIVLMALFALLAAYFFLSHPFIQRRTNFVEGALSVFIFTFLCVNLWTAENYQTSDKELQAKRSVTTTVMGALLGAAMLLRVWWMAHAVHARLKPVSQLPPGHTM